MAYLGTPIDTTNQFQSLQGKRFSGDGSTTAFTLDIAPSSVFDIEVFVENVRQDPNSAYGISGTTLTFTGAPPSGTNNIYVVHQAKAVGTIDVPASGVVPASLASNIISGQTALTSAPDDTDELLISDAGTIKRIDVSLIKSTNTPAFSAVLTSNQDLTSGATTLVAFDTKEFDTDSAFDNTSGNYKFTVPSGKAGKYQFNTILDMRGSGASSLTIATVRIYKNGSAYHFTQFHFQSNNPNEASPQVSILMDLAVSDYIQVYGHVSTTSGGDIRAEEGGAKTTRFSGFRLA